MGEHDAGKLADTFDRSVLEKEAGEVELGAALARTQEFPAVALDATTGPGQVSEADGTEAGAAGPAGQVQKEAEALSAGIPPAANLSGSLRVDTKVTL